MLVSKTIPNLVNGVSQQPPTIRNPTQCEAQENMLSDTVYGVVKRPPFQFVKRLWENPGGLQPFVHTINRNATNQYKVLIADGDLKVFDLTGVEKTVTFPDGKAYLSSADNLSDFQCVTLGDTSYVLNRSFTVTQTSIAVRDFFRDAALISVKQGDYSTDYKVTIETTRSDGPTTFGPISVTKTTSDTLAADIKTSKIAEDLETGINAAALGGGVTVIRSGSVILIYPTQPTVGFSWSMKVAIEDSKGNTNMRLIRELTQKFSDLPTVAPTNFETTIVGDKTSGYDDYTVVFTTDEPDGAMGLGSWAETYRDGFNQAPSASTMPHVLTDNGDGTFTFARGSWNAREAGDSTTNPPPSFIGKNIQYMFTYGNRLGILCGDRVIMSEVGVYTNFFLTTVTTFLDSDPIDIQPLQGNGNWLYAISLSEKLILFSAKSQAVFNGSGDLLTPKTASLKTTTQYPVSPTCEPIILGNNIVFAADNGSFGKVYEYFVQKDVDTLSASDITSQVPKYLPKGIRRIAGDDDSRTLVACGSSVGEPWNIYVYKYYWIGDQKVQSSWSRWALPELLDTSWSVVDVSFIDGSVYLTVFLSGGDILLLRCDLDISKIDVPGPENGALTHLDFKVSAEDVPQVGSGSSRTFTLPFSVPSVLRPLFRAVRYQNSVEGVSWGDVLPSSALTWSEVDAAMVTIDNPEAEFPEELWLGFIYESRLRFSDIHFKEEQNGNQVPTEVGKLTIKKMDILYTGTLYFRAEVTPRNRDTRTYVMTPYILGDPTPLEDVGPRSGKFSIPVNAANDKYTLDIINDSTVQSRIQSAEWTGQYNITSRRV